MILTEYTHKPDVDVPAEESCYEVANRLKSAFQTNDDVIVINDAPIQVEDRIVNVDHLVLHPYGIVLVNSRSLFGRIEVNYRKQWNRVSKNRETPMENPIELYKYVTRDLREFLIKSTQEILSKTNNNQRTFDGVPIEAWFVKAPKTSIHDNGINQSNIIISEQLTQNINRSFSAFKKREFQMYGGVDSFKFIIPDMYATADFILGNPIERENYPSNDGVINKAGNKGNGKIGIVKAINVGKVHLIRGKDIRPSRKNPNEFIENNSEQDIQENSVFEDFDEDSSNKDLF